MKTLDEVIKNLEDGTEHLSAMLISMETWSDALHYLREYQRLQIAFLKALADLEDNLPLTWSELKGMEGKPVYVVYHTMRTKGWALVDYVDGARIDFTTPSAMRLTVFERQMGKIWQAYRKERE